MKQSLLLLTTAIFLFASSYSQSAFKRMPRPVNTQRSLFSEGIPTSATVSSFRFTGPIAGYMYPQNQVVTGLGYGYQRMHWVDSTQRYYTDFSVSAVAYAGGNVTPSVNPNNIISIGLSLGFLNQLIMVGPAYNLPGGNAKGSVGVVFNISVPLN